MKLGPKLIAAPLVTAVLVLGTGIAGEWWMLRAQTEVQAAQHAHQEDLETLAGVQDQLARLHAGNYRTLALMASLDEKAVQQARAELARQLEGARRTLTTLAGDGPMAGETAKAAAQIERYGKQADNALDMAGVDPNTGVAAMQQADATFAELTKQAVAITAAFSQQLDATASEAEAVSRRTLAGGALLGLLVSVLAVTGAWVMQRRLVQDLARAARVADQVAAGRLDAVPDTQRDDELGDVLRSLGRMTGSLAESLRVVQDSSVSIHTASREIASGNTDLSHRTEQAAGSLQRTASAVEQLTGTLTSSADATRQANQLAAGAAQVAQRGGEVVSQVVTTMDQISASSRRIGDIIGTIDGIAFQTNILALNAAVEAARAGEQGRGFAVVAGEVRSLAQRSAEAAREIKALIGSSVERVESGAALVADAGSTMQEIVASVQRVADIIGEVTAATTEQSAGVGDINTAVGQLDRMTQQNAALVEQSAAAAESLQAQAGRLAEVVQRFSLAPST